MSTIYIPECWYGRDFALFRTFRFYGKQKRYYIHDREDMENSSAYFRRKQKHQEHQLFLFFLKLARRLPVAEDKLFSIVDVQRFGELK